jgi:heat shock protein HslJ
VLLTVLAVVAVACSSGGSDSSSSSDSSPSNAATPFEGTQWVLRDAGTLADGGASVTVSARFEDGTVSGDSGCNTYTTGYTISGSTVAIGDNIATTQIACPPLPTAVERAYLGAFAQVTKYVVKGSLLTLSSDDNRVRLAYEASGGESAISGSWVATGFYTGTAISSPVVGSKLTADFADGAVSGDGGCNRFNGSYTLNGDSIKIGPLAATQRACTDAGIGTQEQQYLAALELASTYAVTGAQLELQRADGGIAVTFTKAGK